MRLRSLEDLVRVLKVLSNPLRLRIIASLCDEPKSVYMLAKELGRPYPLVHIYLSSLRRLGLVEVVRVEERGSGLPPVKYYKVKGFKLVLTPELIKGLVEAEG